MSSDFSDIRESVKKYWHNDCIIYYLSEKVFSTPIVVAVHKKRTKVVYIGGWDKNTQLPHGEGKQYKSIGKCDRDRSIYLEGKIITRGKVSHKGSWNQGFMEGFGFHWFPNGCMYKGEWKNNRPDGYGIFFDASKKIDQKGTWEKGEIYNGVGKKTYKNGIYFKGEIINGIPTKNGEYFTRFDTSLEIVPFESIKKKNEDCI